MRAQDVRASMGSSQPLLRGRGSGEERHGRSEKRVVEDYKGRDAFGLIFRVLSDIPAFLLEDQKCGEVINESVAPGRGGSLWGGGQTS